MPTTLFYTTSAHTCTNTNTNTFTNTQARKRQTIEAQIEGHRGEYETAFAAFLTQRADGALCGAVQRCVVRCGAVWRGTEQCSDLWCFAA
jgi:hypothetical protein